MKKFFVAVAVAVLLPASVFAAYVPGSYAVNVNTNIRSMPSMSGALIGHFNRGNSVTVLSVVGSWCRVAYKYRNSYVYCNLLAPTNGAAMGSGTVTGAASVSTVVSSAPATNGLATQNLKSLQNWLLTNNEGVDYINNSYFQVRDAALSWDGEAKIADFYFQWPLLTGPKCSMTFSGSSHLNGVYKGDCFDASGNVKVSKVAVDVPPQSYDLPMLLFKNYVGNLLADRVSMSTLDTYFSKSQHITGLFRLYKDAQGVQRWEGKFIDDNNGNFMVVTADASKTGGSFLVQKGLFQ